MKDFSEYLTLSKRFDKIYQEELRKLAKYQKIKKN